MRVFTVGVQADSVDISRTLVEFLCVEFFVDVGDHPGPAPIECNFVLLGMHFIHDLVSEPI